MPQQISCDLCPKIFANKGNLLRHKQTHTGVKYNKPLSAMKLKPLRSKVIFTKESHDGGASLNSCSIALLMKCQELLILVKGKVICYVLSYKFMIFASWR